MRNFDHFFDCQITVRSIQGGYTKKKTYAFITCQQSSHLWKWSDIYVLSQPGSDSLFLLSERISQDPLENYFGQQRSRGWRCDNQTVQKSLRSAVALALSEIEPSPRKLSEKKESLCLRGGCNNRQYTTS